MWFIASIAGIVHLLVWRLPRTDFMIKLSNKPLFTGKVKVPFSIQSIGKVFISLKVWSPHSMVTA